jgi:hypothetical protein
MEIEDEREKKKKRKRLSESNQRVVGHTRCLGMEGLPRQF